MISLSQQGLINDILALPHAPIILKQLNSQLEKERKRRQKFHDEVTDSERVEFINGKIIVHTSVKKEHNDVSGNLCNLISSFVSKYKLGYLGFGRLMITLSRNDYEPDLCFLKKEKAKKFTQGQSLFPAPDLVVEILSKGTKKNDRGIKFEDYQAHEVMEYWIIDPIQKIVEQYRLNKSKSYELILKSKNGTIECKVIKGFQIAIEAIFDEDKNLKELVRLLGK